MSESADIDPGSHGSRPGACYHPPRRRGALPEERPALIAHSAIPDSAVLTVERRISHEGMVSVGGNLYSAPDLIRMRTREGMAVARAKGKLRGKEAEAVGSPAERAAAHA